MERDEGGAIYKLPSATFYLDPKYTHSNNEWTSKVSVKPVSKEIFESGYDAMTKFGIKIYFVDQETLTKIKLAPDHGLSIISSLKPDNIIL